jgi:hypothetical protein
MKYFINIYLFTLFVFRLVFAGDILGDVGGSMTKGLGGAIGHGCLKLEDIYKNACRKDPSGDILFKCYQKHNYVLNNKLENAGVNKTDINKMNKIRNDCKNTTCNPEKYKTCGMKEKIEFKKKYEEKISKLYFNNQKEFTKICAEVEKCLKQ